MNTIPSRGTVRPASLPWSERQMLHLAAASKSPDSDTSPASDKLLLPQGRQSVRANKIGPFLGAACEHVGACCVTLRSRPPVHLESAALDHLG
jgi:hypothetical protein